MNDAQFIDETEDYFKVYFDGLEGWVKKVDVRDNIVLTAEPRVLNDIKTLNESNNNIIVNAIEVNELLEESNKITKTYSMNFDGINDIVTESQKLKLAVNPTVYRVYSGDLQVCYTTSADIVDAPRYCISVNKAPNYLEEGQTYYSYDGIYFYSSLSVLSIEGETAINKSNPNYNYFQYLPLRTISNYLTTDFISYLNNHEKKYTQSFTQADKDAIGYLTANNEIKYHLVNNKQKCTYSNGDWTSISGGSCVSSNRSMLFNSIESYKNYEYTRGINGLIEFAWAIHESGYGRSAISIFKNNFFGMAAYDSCAADCATTFSSASDGIQAHIDQFVYRYSHPLDWRYYGSHLGDSVSGMNVKYASDKKWGTKIASILYNIDKSLGSKDYDYYTLGIVENSKGLVITDSPSENGILLYNAQSGNNAWTTNYPVVIVGEVGNYYKIKTDTPIKLDYKSYSKVSDRLYSKTQLGVEYDWNNKDNITYGYIPKSYVSYINNPTQKYRDPKSTSEYAKRKAYENFVKHYYNVIHSRNPDESGLNYWVNRLMNNSITVSDVARAFVNSPEFTSKNYNNEQYLDILYKLVHRRNADESGKNFWLSKLKIGLTRDYILVGFLNSNEFKSLCSEYGVNYVQITYQNILDKNEGITEFVYNFYNYAYNRNPDVSGHEYWVNRLSNKTISGQGFALEIFQSREMISLNLSNEEFVTRVYKTLLMRNADRDGQKYWVNRLNNGLTRQGLIEEFSYSTEYINMCNTIGILVR